MIGKVGQGSAIAFNVLYAGRYKLGVSAAAGSKICVNLSYNFANEREQFSRKISEFGMIKKKMSEMVTRSWEADSLNYMTCGSIDESIKDFDKTLELKPNYKDAYDNRGIAYHINKLKK